MTISSQAASDEAEGSETITYSPSGAEAQDAGHSGDDIVRSLGKPKAVEWKVYRIINTISGRSYIGMTKNSIERRFKEHLALARKTEIKRPLYDAIRSYGEDKFIIVLVDTFQTKQDCCNREIDLIAKEDSLYNLARGGEGGFAVSDIEAWKAKLRVARQGAKPSLGMKHTEENKKFFSECSKRRKLLYPAELPTSFKEANLLYGISRTHYYRLRRRAESNDLG